MTSNRKPIFALLALTAAFGAAPAFAQSATDAAAPPQDAGTATDPAAQQQQQQPTNPQTTEPQTSGDASGWAQPAGAKKMGWEEVDADKDGAISKDEATASDGLSQVFDKADADADGKLTADEYKDFVSKNYGEKPQTTP